jgi:hypothetical protein
MPCGPRYRAVNFETPKPVIILMTTDRELKEPTFNNVDCCNTVLRRFIKFVMYRY